MVFFLFGDTMGYSSLQTEWRNAVNAVLVNVLIPAIVQRRDSSDSSNSWKPHSPQRLVAVFSSMDNMFGNKIHHRTISNLITSNAQRVPNVMF